MVSSRGGIKVGQNGHLRSICSGTGQAVRHAKLQAAMEGLMAFLIQTISVKKDHIPPVVSTSTVTFPFDISIAGYSSNPLHSSMLLLDPESLDTFLKQLQ